MIEALTLQRELGPARKYAMVGTLIALATWLFFRVWKVNPAILGDEYLYSMNARKGTLWGEPIAGDFSNYLFNLVYRSANFCGTEFYTCVKSLNILFFLGFVACIFLIAQRYLPFNWALAFSVGVALSPLGVYTSLFLPESMYFFFIGALAILVIEAIRENTPKNWAAVGVILGMASLVKPHAWLSAIAIVLVLVIRSLDISPRRFFDTGKSLILLIAGSVISRVVVGFAVAGPQALSFFGQYLGQATINDLVGTGVESPGNDGGAALSAPLRGVMEVFPGQLSAHFVTIACIMAVAFVVLVVRNIQISKSKKLIPGDELVLFVFIWLASLMLEIVVFTGWVTGQGDDHTDRLLLRYYDFLFVLVPLAAMVALRNQRLEKPSVYLRWMFSVAGLVLITPAFSGFYSSFSVQIADAPTLASLIVNPLIYNAVALMSFFGLLVFATFPRMTELALSATLLLTFVAGGWQIQETYAEIRGTPNSADTGGLLARETLQEDQLQKTWIVGQTRFEVTNAAFWIDNELTQYALYPAGAVLPTSLLPEGISYVFALNGISIEGGTVLREGDGFKIFEVKQSQ